MVKTLPPNTGGTSSIPDWGTKISDALWSKKQNIKQKKYCNEFNKDFLNGPHKKSKKKKNQKTKKQKTKDIKGEAKFHHMQYRKVFHSKGFLNIKLFKSCNIQNRGNLT